MHWVEEAISITSSTHLTILEGFQVGGEGAVTVCREEKGVSGFPRGGVRRGRGCV